jgi:hypothetical protein
MNPSGVPYFVKKIPFTYPNAFHVVNTSTKITHTMYETLEEAKRVAKDMNRMIRRERALKARTVLS